MHFAIRTWRAKCKTEQERLPTYLVDPQDDYDVQQVSNALDARSIEDWKLEDIRQEATEMMKRLDELWEPRRRVIISLSEGMTVAQIAREMRETQQVVRNLIAEARYQLTGRVIVEDLL